jgi:type VI secretion system protein ImpG
VCQSHEDADVDETRATYPTVSTSLSFVAQGGGPANLLMRSGRRENVTVAVQVLLTNRDLPRTGKLRPKDLCVPTIDVPPGLDFADLGAVSVSAPAPVGADGLWRFASHLLLGWDHLRDADSLRELLRLYHFPARYHRGADQKLSALCRAISGVSTQPERRVLGRPPAVLYGTHVVIEVHDTRFEHPGELFLFGTVLSNYLAETASINSFSRLTIHGVDRGSEYAFAPRLGEQALQ